MIQSLTLTAGLLMAVLVQTGDPVTTETVPRQLILLDGAAAEAVIDQARVEVCGEGPCDYVFSKAAEVAGSMCWNDEEAAQLYCRGAVVGTQAEGCEPGPGGALYDCWMHEMMEGSVSAALTDDPRLAAGELRWMSYDRGGDGVYDILESAYCAQPPEGACSRIYNIGVISRPDSDAYSLIFEHCWDDAEAGLARCRQAIIGVADAD